MHAPLAEPYVSVDVETAGPIPATHALLAIGACLVADPREQFYVELRPERDAVDPTAMAVHGLSMEELARDGVPPAEAMAEFERWLVRACGNGQRPVFVGFNAPFDWMFVADAFHRLLGRNPFGHSALDIKAYFMGATGVRWSETSMAHVTSRFYGGERVLTHNALQDAVQQAVLFRAMLEERARATDDRARR